MAGAAGQKHGGPEMPERRSRPSGRILQGWLVEERDHGLYYFFKHVVGGLDVDPATIETSVDHGLGSWP